jgi:hypothetical protein
MNQALYAHMNNKGKRKKKKERINQCSKLQCLILRNLPQPPSSSASTTLISQQLSTLRQESPSTKIL